MSGCSRVSLEKMTRSRRLQLASVNYSMICTWQGSNFLSQVVVADKCVLKAARGSWLVCGRDPWQKSVPKLLFVCISAIKTGRWQIWGWGKTVRGPEHNRPGDPDPALRGAVWDGRGRGSWLGKALGRAGLGVQEQDSGLNLAVYSRS